MPIGFILLIVVTLLIIFGASQRVLDRLRLTDRQALFFVAAIFIGGLLTFQPGINAEVGRRIGNGFAAGTVSILISGIVSVCFILLTRQQANWGATLAMPWYLWIAGVIGVVFVVGATLLAPVLAKLHEIMMLLLYAREGVV